MKKKNTLTSLLAIPIITLSGCMVNNDQIRIPEGPVYNLEINSIKYELYTNMFKNTHAGSDILKVKRGKTTRTYIGSFGINPPEIDFIEKRWGLLGFSRDDMKDLATETKKIVYMQFLIDINKLLKQKSKDEIREILFDKNTPKKEIEKLTQDHLLMYRVYFEESDKKRFRDLYQKRLEWEKLEDSLLKK